MQAHSNWQDVSGESARTEQRHVPELDALRGIAAMVVVLNHYQQMWINAGAPVWVARPRLNPLVLMLVDGHASVILFFLLSGFVLQLPRLRSTPPNYVQYLVRRAFRIYPPFAAALAVSIALCAIVTGKPSMGHAVAIFWPQPPDLHSALAHFSMVRTIDVFRYDGPLWSLVHEARISLVFPLLALAALRMPGWSTVVVAAVCGLVSSCSLDMETGLSSGMRLTAWPVTLGYCGIFLMGAALARHRHACAAMLNRLSRRARVALFAVALLLYLYPLPAWHSINFGDVSIALGGAVLLTFVLLRRGPLATVLQLKPIRYLGTISYSLYLFHLPVLLCLCVLMPQHTSFALLLPLYLACAVGTAAVFYRVIEAPSMAWGRRVSGMLRWSQPKLQKETDVSVAA